MGAGPEFEKMTYDTQGGEKKEVKMNDDGTPAPEPQEQTFIQKYWWYMVIGFLVLQTVGGVDPDAKKGGGRASRE